MKLPTSGRGEVAHAVCEIQLEIPDLTEASIKQFLKGALSFRLQVDPLKNMVRHP
jgi:hypothetical protein